MSAGGGSAFSVVTDLVVGGQVNPASGLSSSFLLGPGEFLGSRGKMLQGPVLLTIRNAVKNLSKEGVLSIELEAAGH